MSTPLSLDLQVRVLTAVIFGLSHREAGERFGVSAASVSRWRALEREQGDTRPRPMGGDQRSHAIEAHGDLVVALREAEPCANRQSEPSARSGTGSIGLALHAFTPTECANYFAAAGYDAA